MRLASLCLALGLVACGDDGGGGSPDAPRPDAEVVPDALVLPTGPADVELLTFNVGLIGIVKGSEERMPHILAAVEASGADIVCFQEVYTQYTSPEEFAEALADVYPYSAVGTANPNNNSNGLLIVSKYPLHAPRFFKYTMNETNGVVDRAVLAATAVADDWGLHVLCTHIQAGLDAPNTAVRRDQLRELGLFVEEHGYADGPTVLMGDFNAGPDPDPTDIECPKAGTCDDTCTPADTQTITEMETLYGWTDHSDERGFTECTWCKADADALAVLDFFPCDGSQRIDYCFTRGLVGSDVAAIERVMDRDDHPNLMIDIGGGEFAETLSDHFAVQCSIDPT